MRRYAEIVRKCSPFLLVYSKGENIIDAEEVRKRVEGVRRKRRELGYFSYNAGVETTSLASSTSTEKLTEDMRSFRRHFVENPSSPRRKKVRGNRNKSPEDDIWHGFGESSEDKEKVNDEKSNDVRVVLLGAEEKKAMCQRRSSMIDLRLLGWGRWVIAPATFEAGFCSGKCPNPLPKDMNPSNHAILQSLLQSASIPAVCCSPDQMQSLTIFYRDEIGRSTIRNFENMIVDSCTCQ
ncbi:unnamed protein product [Strongylus vulgaris]|uniref:TGF-beta family profile domain-containing protein n=1 Tax=Strongylus vulgaris TaxID=40348 RepID=A0A3P7ILU8_STRVU|nr:unnamed protein product [Strongylus vulgaris]